MVKKVISDNPFSYSINYCNKNITAKHFTIALSYSLQIILAQCKTLISPELGLSIASSSSKLAKITQKNGELKHHDNELAGIEETEKLAGYYLVDVWLFQPAINVLELGD
jgi:hypothetical protein